MKQPLGCEWWTLRVTSPAIGPEFALGAAQVFASLERGAGPGLWISPLVEGEDSHFWLTQLL